MPSVVPQDLLQHIYRSYVCDGARERVPLSKRLATALRQWCDPSAGDLKIQGAMLSPIVEANDERVSTARFSTPRDSDASACPRVNVASYDASHVSTVALLVEVRDWARSLGQQWMVRHCRVQRIRKMVTPPPG